MRRNPANTKVNEEGGEGKGASDAKAEMPLQHMERTVLEQISILQPMEHPTLELVDTSRRNSSLWRTHAGAGTMCEEEGEAERSNYRLTQNPHSPSLCAPRGGGEVEELGVRQLS